MHGLTELKIFETQANSIMPTFVSRTFMICVRDTFETLSGTCLGLCRKVGVMEFGLIETWRVCLPNIWEVPKDLPPQEMLIDSTSIL